MFNNLEHFLVGDLILMTYMYDMGQYCNEKIDANHSKGSRCQSFVVRSIFDWSGRGTFY